MDTKEDRKLCHCTTRLQGAWDIIVFGYSAVWLWNYSVIFLNSMCPLLPVLVVCYSDLPTFSSSFFCCNVNWQIAFPLCLIVSAYFWFQLILYLYLLMTLLYLGFSLSFVLSTIVCYLHTSRKDQIELVSVVEVGWGCWALPSHLLLASPGIRYS